MPHFHFHQQDGTHYPDAAGVELPNMEAARATALRAFTEMVRDHAHDFWSSGEWRMTVTDDTGLSLFWLDLVATEAPAVRGPGTAETQGGGGPKTR